MEVNISHVMVFDLSIYPKEAILKTARQYSDEADFSLQVGENKSDVVVSYCPKKTDTFDSNDFENEFKEKLLFQSIRELIAIQTQTVKELLIGRALYHTCILASSEATAND